MENKLNLWVEEKYSNIASLKFKIKRHLFSQKSQYQQVDIVETEGFGKMLLNDGLVMVSERDEFVYHEMIAHVPLFIHPNPQQVLIIGGGDGGSAREVIRHMEVQKCHMVEIDRVVVDACKEHIPQTSCELDNSLVKLHIEDGVKFVKETKERFDVILIDSTDPIGPASPLFGEAFYRNVNKILTPNGIVIAQGESPFYYADTQKSGLALLGKIFSKVHIYNFSNLTYPGGLWSFWYASQALCPINDFKPERVKDSGLKFSYYNTEIHKAAFALPEFMRKELGDLLTPINL